MGRRTGDVVVVIGGGPAGCAAAVTLARNGCSVTLVVGRRTPRAFGVGEGGPPGLDRVVDDVFGPGTFRPRDHLRSLGNRAAWGTDELLTTDFMLNPYGTGWHLDRLAFDARLRAAAEAAGVAVRTALDADAARWAPLVIDASGRQAHHARGAGARRVGADRLVGVLATYAGADAIDATTTVEAAEGGWWYTCPIPQGRRVVGFFTDGDLVGAELRTSAGFDRRARQTVHIAPRLPSSTPSSPLVVAAGAAHLAPPCGRGWLAAGDAAASFDPLSSQGILTALLMGREAANCLLDHRAYASRYAEVVAHYEAEHRELYALEDRWPDAPFWARRHGRDLAAGPAATP